MGNGKYNRNSIGNGYVCGSVCCQISQVTPVSLELRKHSTSPNGIFSTGTDRYSVNFYYKKIVEATIKKCLTELGIPDCDIHLNTRSNDRPYSK